MSPCSEKEKTFINCPAKRARILGSYSSASFRHASSPIGVPREENDVERPALARRGQHPMELSAGLRIRLIRQRH
eukprot:5522421-Pyramimonas_sp.AAC.1